MTSWSSSFPATSALFNDIGDDLYADKCLDHARKLFIFGNVYRGNNKHFKCVRKFIFPLTFSISVDFVLFCFLGSYIDSIPEAKNRYNSWNGYKDELVWAAIWIASASGSRNNLTGFYNLERFTKNHTTLKVFCSSSSI